MRIPVRSVLLACLVCSAIWVAGTVAQERRGSITGRVTDASQGVLPGARVDLQPGENSAVSDGHGEFTLTNIVPGKYTLTVSYVGFEPYSRDVNVTGEAAQHLDVTLQVATQSEMVTVRGERERGEVEAINIERTADNIIQVLPNEVITSLPNTNIADAVGRLPSVSLERDEGEGKYIQIRGTEPRLSNVTIDGIHLPSPEGVRNVKLDAIPADLVDMVEISKTLSANQDADAIGGSVNLVTKSADDKPYVSVLGMFGYTPISERAHTHQFDATAGQRFGPTKSSACFLVEAMTTMPVASMISSQPTLPHRWSQTRWTCGIIFTIAPATVSAERPTIRSEICRRYICAGFIPSSKTLESNGPTRRGSMFSSPVRRIQTIRVESPPREQRRAAAAWIAGCESKARTEIFSIQAGARHAVRSRSLAYQIALSQAHYTGGFPRMGFDGPGAIDNSVPSAWIPRTLLFPSSTRLTE